MEQHEYEPEQGPEKGDAAFYGALSREGMSYRITVRAVLWVIAAAVFLGFAVWWVLT